MTRWLAPVLALVAVQPGEPAPTRATPQPPGAPAPVTYVTSVAELPDGRLVVSDHRAPAVVIVGREGQVSPLTSIGAGPGQIVGPGGLYPAADGSIRLLDRAQAGVLIIKPDGTVGESYSIEIKGVRTASSADRDAQMLDARGFAYFSDRFGTLLGARAPSKTMPLVRFEPKAQGKETIADLMLPESRRLDRGDGMVLTRAVHGSPADGWAVAPDGRVAVVRGSPYRVDWIAPDGTVTRGPETVYTPLPMTEADRQAYLNQSSGVVAGGGAVGARSSGGGMNTGIEPSFADTKAPFSPDGVFVSFDAEVWVERTQPAGTPAVVYDVFDSRGRRVARLEFPAGSRLVGFGRGAVYMADVDAAGRHALRKYGRR